MKIGKFLAFIYFDIFVLGVIRDKLLYLVVRDCLNMFLGNLLLSTSSFVFL